jgi:hypothetical protein
MDNERAKLERVTDKELELVRSFRTCSERRKSVLLLFAASLSEDTHAERPMSANVIAFPAPRA